ncbi:MAG: 4-alpha-glucanotransferase, partial [Deltaproteobacteria bacterium]|nr:4-alpha-glucanotransferase [Deltaproteobacteria bacterium]
RRRGAPIELQALWTSGARTLSRLAALGGDAELAERAARAADRTRDAFRARYWCEATRYPYDCLRRPDDADGPIADTSVRANALVALDVDPSLFERWQAQAVLERVRASLRTPRGIRSLDPEDPGYRGEHEGTPEERRLALHRGLGWTHLLGAYARASLRLSPDDFDLAESLRVLVEQARLGGPVLLGVTQFAEGDAPYRPGGCPAQAASVAELLRTLVVDLRLC